MKRLPLLVALAAAAGGAAAGDVYKWTDKDGVVQYTETQPPAPIKSELVHVATKAKTATAAANDADEAATPPAGGTPVSAANAPNADKRCEQARTNLEVLRGGAAVGIDDGSGKAQALDDQARASRVAHEQQMVRMYCK